MSYAQFLSIITSIFAVTVNYVRFCSLDVSIWVFREEGSVLYLSFPLFFIKREITLEVATFGGSLLSRGRYFRDFTVRYYNNSSA